MVELRIYIEKSATFYLFVFLVVHGSMSTILGVLVLAFINSYMVLVFFKTIFLVLVIGIFHALVLLPIVLHDTAPLTDRLSDWLHRRQEMKNARRKSRPNSVFIVVNGDDTIR
jgi:hypothetical protein